MMQTKRTLWITGAGGMLGQDLRHMAGERGFICLGTDREVDITDAASVRAFLQKNQPNLIINCAAYTAVDKAETETELNLKINGEGPAVLGKCAAEAGIGVIHVSTDYVLNGAPPEPLNEQAGIDPQNAYGRAKAEGEKRLAAANPQHWIVRTAWLYGIHGNNFVKTMLRLMSEKESLRVVDDQRGNPTWTLDLAAVLLHIAESGEHPGIYHFTGEGITSWHGFATEIQKRALALGLLERAIPIEPVASSAYPTPAVRPAWSALDKTKIRTVFGWNVPAWQESLQQYLELEKNARG